MEAKDEGKIAQIREEHSQRVFALYESKSKSFRHFLAGVAGFALAFFFLILLPYFSIHIQGHKISRRLEALPGEIAEKQKRIVTHENLAEGVQKLCEAIAAGPQNLRHAILALKNSDFQPAPSLPEGTMPPIPNSPFDFSPVQQMQPTQRMMQQNIAPLPDSCAHLPENERIKCKIRQAVMAQFDDLGNIMQESILRPLQNPEVAATVMLDTLAIRQGLDSLRAEFNRKFEANAEFWRTYSGKTGFFVELDDEVKRFWSTYGAALQSQSDKLHHELEQLNKSKNDFEQQVALVAPLWIDPINKEQNRTIKLAVLLLPPFFFVAAFILIVYLWTLPNALSSPIQPWVYGALYTVSLGLFVFGCRQIQEALHQYNEA